jgi:hypothetical protein
VQASQRFWAELPGLVAADSGADAGAGAGTGGAAAAAAAAGHGHTYTLGAGASSAVAASAAASAAAAAGLDELGAYDATEQARLGALIESDSDDAMM